MWLSGMFDPNLATVFIGNMTKYYECKPDSEVVCYCKYIFDLFFVIIFLCDQLFQYHNIEKDYPLDYFI